MDAVQQFESWAERTSRLIGAWANPDVAYDSRATKDWAFTRLDHALYVLAAYGFLVAFGMAIRPANWKELAKNSATDRPAIRPHWFTRFSQEPILWVQTMYNLVQVSLCLFMIVGTLRVHRKRGFGLFCVDYDPQDREMAFMLWVFYTSKILDFCDTIFIVWRRSWVRFSFLHIYHHASIFFMYWVNVNFAYGGDCYYTIVANSFIHLLMYWYYFQSSVGSAPKWGKYLTMMQMFQFITMNIQAITILLNPEQCHFPRRVTMTYLVYIISLFVLFMQFFLRKHGGSGKGKSGKAKSE